MSETSRLELPLLAPSQAQKHVTVNEALERLDLLSQLSIASATTATPPAAAADGTTHFVPEGSVNAWSGQDNKLALGIGGGWVFVDPKIGMRGWIEDEARFAVWNGSDWTDLIVPMSPSGAGMLFRSVEIDHVVAAGATSTTSIVIPEGALVFAVTGRVLSEITGSVASFELGVDGASSNRYGAGIGVAAGSWLRGVTSSPVAYYEDTALTLTAQGGVFSAGLLRLVVHFAEFTLPSA